jgi:hypothetical protein
VKSFLVGRKRVVRIGEWRVATRRSCDPGRRSTCAIRRTFHVGYGRAMKILFVGGGNMAHKEGGRSGEAATPDDAVPAPFAGHFMWDMVAR